MVKLTGNFLKTAEVEAGDLVTFKDAGEWVKSTKFTYEDGTPKTDFIIKVDHNGVEKSMRLNKTNREILKSVYGDETEAWVGKSATITKLKALVAGKMQDCIILEVGVKDEPPKNDTPWDE